jgi:hypothetical protein
MRFAVAIPQFYADGGFDPAAFRHYFSRVEALGCYDSAWAQELEHAEQIAAEQIAAELIPRLG